MSYVIHLIWLVSYVVVFIYMTTNVVMDVVMKDAFWCCAKRGQHKGFFLELKTFLPYIGGCFFSSWAFLPFKHWCRWCWTHIKCCSKRCWLHWWVAFSSMWWKNDLGSQTKSWNFKETWMKQKPQSHFNTSLF